MQDDRMSAYCYLDPIRKIPSDPTVSAVVFRSDKCLHFDLNKIDTAFQYHWCEGKSARNYSREALL